MYCSAVEIFSFGFHFFKASFQSPFLSTLFATMEALCMNILLWYRSYLHSWCSIQIRGEQLQYMCHLLSPLLSCRLVLQIWCQLTKQPRSLQPGFALFDILIVIFLSLSILCLIHRLKSSLMLDSSLGSLDLKHLTWLLLPLLESIVC